MVKLKVLRFVSFGSFQRRGNKRVEFGLYFSVEQDIQHQVMRLASSIVRVGETLGGDVTNQHK